MKRFLFAISMIAAVVTPSVARSADASAAYGVGPHGYDWQIGTWSCVNSMPSINSESGPTHQMVTASKVSGGAILFHTTGTNFDFSDYNIYVPAKKMWLSPFSGNDGSYGTETTTQTGMKTVWVGSSYFPSSGKTMPTRDTYVNTANKYTDLGEYSIGGVWKKQYNVTCTRT